MTENTEVHIDDEGNYEDRALEFFVWYMLCA